MSAIDPEKLGEFEILEKLGHGGMGAVYKARQSSLGRMVALKVLPGNMAHDHEFITRFKAEARAAASLNHPGIVQVYAAGEDGGVHYFAMEYVDGESLHQRLKRKGRIAPADALVICTHVATALNHGWRRAQLIHRDIKPENIFLSNEGDVKLGDLGLAKSVSAESSNLTQTGTSLGTPFYISPEQAEGGGVVDFRSDIYSLGCTLYHLVSGETPYNGTTAMAVIVKHITQPPPNIFAVYPECPAALGPLLARMLAKKPASRHQSYEELLQDFSKTQDALARPQPVARKGGQIPAAVGSPVKVRPARYSNPGTIAAHKKSRLGLALAAGGAALAAILLLSWAPWRPRIDGTRRLTGKNIPAPIVTAPPTSGAASSPTQAANPIAASPPSSPASAPGAVPTTAAATPGSLKSFSTAAQGDLSAPGTDFVSLFNGQDLSGWNGDSKHWWVAGGVIIGSATPANPADANSALVWSGGPVSDFTLRLSYKVMAGSCGLQYRGRVLDGSPRSLGGYQFSMHAIASEKNGALFEERGVRWLMGAVGYSTLWPSSGSASIVSKLDVPPVFHLGEWNDLEITAHDHRLVHRLNGVVAADVIDDDPALQTRTGLLGLQLLKGRDATVQFKDIRLRQGTPVKLAVSSPPPPPATPPIATPAPTPPSPATPPTGLTTRLAPGGGVVFQGESGPGLGKNIVLLAGEDEYRSEELLPQLAAMLAVQHGFTCTVLFSTNPQTGEIDPGNAQNIPGLEALATADLCILMMSGRRWTDVAMKTFADYYLAGRPFVALRTSLFAFNGLPPASPYNSFNFNSAKWPGGFGRQVLGETWTTYWGEHNVQGTRAIAVPSAVDEPILRGVNSFVGSTSVFEAAPPPDAKVLMRGQVLAALTDAAGAASGRKKALNGIEQDINAPMMPIAWTREVKNAAGKTNRVFTCTMGSVAELQEESFRRLLVNACYWTLNLTIPEKNRASVIGEFKPHDQGAGKFVRGLKPSNYLLPGSTAPSAPIPAGRRITLFDGTNTSAWIRRDGQPCDWPIVTRALQVGDQNLETKEKFQDFILHVEFWIPRYPPTVARQARGESGIYLQHRYDLEIFETTTTTPTDRDCGAIYRQRAPDRNAGTPPETWQTFDITFRAARFDSTGYKIANARINVIQNGITIHNNVEIPAGTGTGLPEDPTPGPIVLDSNQGRGVRFRNIWIIPQ